MKFSELNLATRGKAPHTIIVRNGHQYELRVTLTGLWKSPVSAPKLKKWQRGIRVQRVENDRENYQAG
jgi:hypothetical protein